MHDKHPERRKDLIRREILKVINDPVLILFARGKKDPKEIEPILHVSSWSIRKRIRSFLHRNKIVVDHIG